MDVAAITAIDVHTHVHRSVRSDPGEDADGNEDMGAYFGIGSMRHYTVPELAGYYRERNMACVDVHHRQRVGDRRRNRCRTASRSPSSPPSTRT